MKLDPSELSNIAITTLVCGAQKITDEKFEFKRALLIPGNLAILLWSALATVGIWFTYTFGAWIFFVSVLVIVFVILRRLGCNTCAYCKTCTMGFGRISGWFFGSRSVKDTGNKTALVFVGIVYALLGIVPIVIVANSMVQEFTALKAVLLACVAGLLVLSLATWFRKTPAQTVASSDSSANL